MESVTREIEITEDNLIDVTFFAKPRVENDGIGSYEYWGAKCYDRGHDYISCSWEGIWWNKEECTPEQNEIIEKYLDNNHSDIEDELCQAYARTLEYYRED